jgi:hypothetical protein
MFIVDTLNRPPATCQVFDLYSTVTQHCGAVYNDCDICKAHPCSYHYNPKGAHSGVLSSHIHSSFPPEKHWSMPTEQVSSCNQFSSQPPSASRSGCRQPPRLPWGTALSSWRNMSEFGHRDTTGATVYTTTVMRQTVAQMCLLH